MGWVLSVDFGSTATAVAASEGDARHLIQADGAPCFPSAVARPDDGPLLVGVEAERLTMVAPDRVERTPKRRLSDTVMLLGGVPVSPVDAAAAVLGHARSLAVADMGSDPAALRLTHPARWGPARLELLEEAAIRAELPRPLFLSEPVAAAVHAIDAQAADRPIAVYDLGGGTFDTAVVASVDGRLELIGPPGGNEYLGGEALDDLLFRSIGEALAERHPDAWEAIQSSEERTWVRAAHELRGRIRAAKEALSTTGEYVISLGAPVEVDLTMTRNQLEGVLRPELETTVEDLDRTVSRAGLTANDLGAVVLVGGSSRIPLIQSLLEAWSGAPARTWGDPKSAVVLGASDDRSLSTLRPLHSEEPPAPTPKEPAGPEPVVTDTPAPPTDDPDDEPEPPSAEPAATDTPEPVQTAAEDPTVAAALTQPPPPEPDLSDLIAPAALPAEPVAAEAVPVLTNAPEPITSGATSETPASVGATTPRPAPVAPPPPPKTAAGSGAINPWAVVALVACVVAFVAIAIWLAAEIARA